LSAPSGFLGGTRVVGGACTDARVHTPRRPPRLVPIVVVVVAIIVVAIVSSSRSPGRLST
jgi:hypothetical protein